jgi:hypothetical protein
MSSLWVAPMLLALLSLAWFAVQRAWLACMKLPADRDALARPGHCGASCGCCADCPRRKDKSPLESSHEETAS